MVSFRVGVQADSSVTSGKSVISPPAKLLTVFYCVFLKVHRLLYQNRYEYVGHGIDIDFNIENSQLSTASSFVSQKNIQLGNQCPTFALRVGCRDAAWRE